MVRVRRRPAPVKRPRGEAAAPAQVVGNRSMGDFDVLPQEIIVSILAMAASAADSPTHLFNTMLACKEFFDLVMRTPEVLKVASAACMSVRRSRWCCAAARFLSHCADQGNQEANYFLGMAQFYCFSLPRQGWERLMAAARAGHAHAAFAAAVISYNAPFFPDQKNLHDAARLFAQAASHGHIGAIRDLAFCVGQGHGVPQDLAAGRRLTVIANARELRARFPEGPGREAAFAHIRSNPRCLVSQFGCSTAVDRTRWRWAHPANRFLAEFFASRPLLPLAPLRLPLVCCMPTCGIPETRGLEFRRCEVCGIARYCSRTCQALHWRMGHTRECAPVHQWLLQAVVNEAVNVQLPAAAVAAVNPNVGGPPM